MRCILGKGDHTVVDGVVQHILVHEVGPSILHMHIDRGIGLEEVFDVGWQLVETNAIDCRELDRAGDHLLHLLKFAIQPLVEVKNLLGHFVELLPLTGQTELLLAAVHDEDLEMLLHRTELLAHRRLGDAVQFSSPGKALAFDEIREGSEIFYMHKRQGSGVFGVRFV